MPTKVSVRPLEGPPSSIATSLLTELQAQAWPSIIRGQQHPIVFAARQSFTSTTIDIGQCEEPVFKMVLENSTAESDGFDDAAPNSDNDTYESSNENGEAFGRYRVNFTNLPKAMPVLGPLLGYDRKFTSTVLAAKLKVGETSLQRPLTQPEVDAFAYWTSRQISIFSYGSPIGFAGGLWRASGTAKTFRFPFWQPNPETFNPAAGFPHPNMASLKGAPAIYAWHALRALLYGSMGVWFSKLFFGSYSMSVATVGELSDKRLSSFLESVRASAQRRQGSLPGGPSLPGPQKRPVSNSKPVGQVDDASPSGGMLVTDDASPTGGMFYDENTTAEDSGSSSSPTSIQRGQYTTPTQNQSGEDVPDSVTPNTPAPGSRTSPASGGSAWDRLRRGETPSKAQANEGQSAWSRQQNGTQNEQRDGSTLGDSFAFSKTEEERAFAKDKAQKEFDARIERERRGGDFSKNNGDQKRW